MPRKTLKRWIAIAAVATPVVVPAQVALPSGPEEAQNQGEFQVGGKSSMDLIRLDTQRFSFPLRYGLLRTGSERVELDGQLLLKDRDYTIDYEAGVVYLMRPFRDGQSLRVQYKYDQKSNQVGLFAPKEAQSAGFSGLKLEFSPGSAFFLGLGMTERLSDGTVLSSNVYGVANGFASSFGTIKGFVMLGERMRSNGKSLLGDYGDGRAQKDEGKGTAIVQNFQSEALGGKVSADYQDVDAKFAGFDALKQNGMAAKDVDAIRKERGLKRSGFDVSKLGFGAIDFSSGFRTVGDADGAINWRSYGVQIGGLGFSFDSQSVDKTFSRFNDLREGDKDALKKEKGLDREIMKAGYAFGGGKLSYSTFGLTDDQNKGIDRSVLGFESAFLKLDYYDQSIDQGFSQFAGLRASYDKETTFDVGQMQKERGMSRKGFAASTSQFGATLNFKSSSVGADDKAFRAEDFGGKLGAVSVQYARRDVEKGFGRLGSLSAAELNPSKGEAHVESIVTMIDPSKKPSGNDVQMFQQSAGIDRELWRIGYNFGGDMNLRVDDLNIRGDQDELMSQAYTLTGPKYNFSYRNTIVGNDFNEISRLTPTEQSVLGLDRGLAKSNFDFSAALSKTSKFSFSQMVADISGEGAMRQVFGYNSKGLELNWSRRSVDQGFGQVSRLMDPERDYLFSLMGFDQTNLTAKMDLIPGIGVKLNWSQADSKETDEQRLWRESQIDWRLTGKTTVSAYRAEQYFHDQDLATVDRQFDRLMLQHDLGRFGLVSLVQELRTFDGEEDDNKDSLTQKVAFKTNINKSTQFETEQSETRFDGGSRETSTTNTLATKVTNRLGVSVTDTKVLRDGEEPDASKRNYGFWYDFGKGIKLSFGQARDLSNPSQATKNVSTELTAGQFSGLEVKSLKYTHDMWDHQRNKTMGNVNLATAKPLDWGLVDKVEFFYQADTLRDLDSWKKEDRAMGITGAIGNVGLGFGYRSQISPNGDRAIDRVFSFKSDSTGKAPIRAELNYDMRTMPNNEIVAIRDLKLVAKVGSDWQLGHSMLTNPIENRQGVLLGGVAKDVRTNNWTVSYLGSKSIKSSFAFEEMTNDKTNVILRKTGFDVTLFAENPSPISLGYRAVENDGSGPRSLQHEFYFRFDQRPGENQSLSFMLGNMNYTGFRPSGKALQDWMLRLDYGIRF